MQNGSSSNRFSRELASETNTRKLLSFILNDNDYLNRESASPGGHPGADSLSSSMVTSMNIIIELIRKNNSDDSESYLFHTLRNRLIQVQRSFNGLSGEDPREILERAMNEMTEKTGVVQLGVLLNAASDRLEDLKALLLHPHPHNVSNPICACDFRHKLMNTLPNMQAASITTSTGVFQPLTFERLRICELFVELLHCSNMSLLNRRAGSGGPVYDTMGHLLGGLSALEQLAHAVSTSASSEGSRGTECIQWQ